MLCLPSDEQAYQGFCWGTFETTVDTASRIRLNKGVTTVLKANKVRQLWRFPDPTGPRLIFCPPNNKLIYIKAVQKTLGLTEKDAAAWRKFISPGEPAPFDKQGRLALTAACVEHTKIQPGDQVVLVGAGLWYEVWQFDQWVELVRR